LKSVFIFLHMATPHPCYIASGTPFSQQVGGSGMKNRINARVMPHSRRVAPEVQVTILR
jgi:hypothetical protein